MSFIVGCRSCDFLWGIRYIWYLQFWQYFLLLLTFGGMFSSFPNSLQIKLHWSFLVIWKLFHQKSSQKYRKRGFYFFIPCLVSKIENFHEIFPYVWETWKIYFFIQILLIAQQCCTSLFCWEKHQTNFLEGQNTFNQELWWLELTSLAMTR